MQMIDAQIHNFIFNFSCSKASFLSLSLSSAPESGPMSGLAYCAGLAVHQGALNPARALGPAVVANRYFLLFLLHIFLYLNHDLAMSVFYNSWKLHWIFWVGPGLGGATAALTHQLIYAQVSSEIV